MKNLLQALVLLVSTTLNAQFHQSEKFDLVKPSHYMCYKIEVDLNIDGELNEDEWALAPWSELFVDIEGRDKELPSQDTRLKMLYNQEFVYFAFEIKEKHIWASIEERDAVIYLDNDIEIFIDANGDTHNYLELELNALNTVWDLFLAKPYREGGPILNEFNFKDLQTAIKINGTLNDPSDEDESWIVEVAIPWSNIISTNTPKRVPEQGESMRMNFSRVQWQTEVVDGKYVKKINPETGRTFRENNWVWSPTGKIDIHRPEYWGIVTFTEEFELDNFDKYYISDIEELRQYLSHLYKRQKAFLSRKGRYAENLQELGANEFMIRKYNLRMGVMAYSFEIVGTNSLYKKTFMTNQEGQIKSIK